MMATDPITINIDEHHSIELQRKGILTQLIFCWWDIEVLAELTAEQSLKLEEALKQKREEPTLY